MRDIMGILGIFFRNKKDEIKEMVGNMWCINWMIDLGYVYIGIIRILTVIVIVCLVLSLLVFIWWGIGYLLFLTNMFGDYHWTGAIVLGVLFCAGILIGRIIIHKLIYKFIKWIYNSWKLAKAEYNMNKEILYKR